MKTGTATAHVALVVGLLSVAGPAPAALLSTSSPLEWSVWAGEGTTRNHFFSTFAPGTTIAAGQTAQGITFAELDLIGASALAVYSAVDGASAIGVVTGPSRANADIGPGDRLTLDFAQSFAFGVLIRIGANVVPDEMGFGLIINGLTQPFRPLDDDQTGHWFSGFVDTMGNGITSAVLFNTSQTGGFMLRGAGSAFSLVPTPGSLALVAVGLVALRRVPPRPAARRA